MKIFGWMLNKRNRSEVSNKPNQESMSYDHMMQHHCKEVFSDWPTGLLAIGTLGNSDKLSVHANNENTASQVQDNFDEEEEEEVIDKELRLLLSNHISLDREKLFLDCLREDEEKPVHALENEDARMQRTTSSIVNKGAKDARLNNNNNKKKNGIGKKSISFLIKKALLCRGGFVLRDPLPDTTKVENSRMDKILRALLHKKIYPQRPTSKSGSKKYLDNRPATVVSDDEEYEEAFRQSKWVKTDSEYIVLEI